MFNSRKRITREYKEAEGPTKKIRTKEIASVESYYAKMRSLYIQLHKENHTIPQSSEILRTLCDEYWQEGQKNKRKGQHDLLAKGISQKLIANIHIINALNDVLKNVSLNHTSPFANLLRAFLAYHASYISGLDSSILDQLKPRPYSFGIEDDDLKLLIGKTRNGKVCRILGNLAHILPEEHKQQVITVLQNPIDLHHKNHYPAVDACAALVKIANVSSDEIRNDILKFFMDKERWTTYWESRKATCEAFVSFAHQAKDSKVRASLIEIIFNFVSSAMNDVKMIGFQALGEMAQSIPDHLKEEVVSHILSIQDFYVANADFQKIFCETLAKISRVVSDELKEKIILNLQDRLGKKERYTYGYELTRERIHLSIALVEIVQDMAVLRHETLVRFCLDRLDVKDFSLGCVIALGKAASIIPPHLREVVICALIGRINRGEESTEVHKACFSLGELKNIISHELIKPVIVALCTGRLLAWEYASKALAELAEKFSAEIADYLENQFYQGEIGAKSMVASIGVSLAKWLPEKLSEDIFILKQNQLDSDERNQVWYLCDNLSELALSHEALRRPAVLALLKQLKLGDNNLRGTACEALAQMAYVIPENLHEFVVLRIQELMKDDSVFVREHACEALGKMGGIIPVLFRESIVRDIVKKLDDERWIPEKAAAALDQLVPIVPKHVKRVLAQSAAEQLRTTSHYGGYKESCQVLNKLINTLPESTIDSLFEFLLKNIRHFNHEIYQRVLGLMEQMLDRFPKKWGVLVATTVCENTKQWNFVWETIFKKVIQNASIVERNFYLFGVVDSTIMRLKSEDKGVWHHEKEAEEQALLSLIQMKAEFCHLWQMEMLMNQGLPSDLTRVVMGYL